MQISTKVSGLGPLFLLKVTLQNTGSLAETGCALQYNVDPELYTIGAAQRSGSGANLQSQRVPLLLPGAKHCYEVDVWSVHPSGKAGSVTLALVPKDSLESQTPIVSATVRMPQSEVLD